MRKSITGIVLCLSLLMFVYSGSTKAEEQEIAPQKLTYNFKPGDKMDYDFNMDMTTELSEKGTEGLMAMFAGQKIKTNLTMAYMLTGKKPELADTNSLTGKIALLTMRTKANIAGMDTDLKLVADGIKTTLTMNGQDASPLIKSLGLGNNISLDFVGKDFNIVVTKNGKLSSNGMNFALQADKLSNIDVNSLGGFFPIIAFPDRELKPGDSWDEKSVYPGFYQGVTIVEERKFTVQYFKVIEGKKTAKIAVESTRSLNITEEAKKIPEVKKLKLDMAVNGHVMFDMEDSRIYEIEMELKQDLCVPVKQMGSFIATKSTGKFTTKLKKPDTDKKEEKDSPEQPEKKDN